MHVNDLPIELLVHIFFWLEPTSRRDIQLTHVCSLWRDVLWKTPRYWTALVNILDVVTLANEQRVAFWRSAIERTGSLNLSLALRAEDYSLINTPGVLERLSSLFLVFGGSGRDMNALLEEMLPMPALETLRCDIFTTYALPRFRKPLTHVFPCLRHLHLMGPYYPGMVVPSLCTLTIVKGTLHLRRFLEALAVCPRLELLSMDRVRISGLTLNTRPVSLPCLQELSLTASHFSIWKRYMLRLVATPSPMVHLSLEGVNGSLYRYVNLVRLHERVEGTDKVVLTYALEDHRYSRILHLRAFKRGMNWLDLTLHNIVWAPNRRLTGRSVLLADVPRIFGVDPPVVGHIALPNGPNLALSELHLTLADGAGVIRDDWKRLFEALPNLVALVVRIRSCRNLFGALRGTEGPLLPLLENLGVVTENGTGVHEHVVSFLERRAESGLGLRRFVFQNAKEVPFSTARLARMKAVVAEVVTGPP